MDRPDVHAPMFHGAHDGRLERLRACRIQELGQPCDGAADVSAALCHGLEEGLARRRRLRQPIHRAVLASRTFAFDQLRDVTLVLDLLSAADRKSTRLNSSHVKISYAVFCLKKKKR